MARDRVTRYLEGLILFFSRHQHHSVRITQERGGNTGIRAALVVIFSIFRNSLCHVVAHVLVLAKCYLLLTRVSSH